METKEKNFENDIEAYFAIARIRNKLEGSLTKRLQARKLE